MLGQITPWEEIRTDRRRLDSYSDELVEGLVGLVQKSIPNPKFKKIEGYKNVDLRGIVFRAPYGHAGSIPTLAALLTDESLRPSRFRTGVDIMDHKEGGYLYKDEDFMDPETYHLFDTSLEGNGNRGHSGAKYGTNLAPAKKVDLIRFLKTL